MNIAFGTIFIIISIFLGYRLSTRYTEKKDFYKNFKLFNNKLENEVSFSNNTILSIIKQSDINVLFYNLLSQKILNGQEGNISFITKDEKEYFYNYLETIGKTDKATQLKLINATKIYLTEKLKISEEDEKKYKTLYIKMGFLIGLLIFILII